MPEYSTAGRPVIELSALRVPRLHRESPVKGATRRDYAQVSIEHHKRLPDGINYGLRQAVPVRQGSQWVVIGHARRILIYLRLGFYHKASR